MPPNAIPQATSPGHEEVLAGLVERITFHNADNGFCVLRVNARGHRDLVTLVGHAAAIRPLSAPGKVPAPESATGAKTMPKVPTNSAS